MLIKIETSSFIPIYEQIRNEVRSRIVLGLVKPDEPLPSIRDLAADLVINPNTVARAYRELEQEGLIYTRKGKGSFVAAGSASQADKERVRILDQIFSRAIEEGARFGSGREEMNRVFEECLKAHSLPGEGGPR